MKEVSYRLVIGDALTELRKLPSQSVDCCVTSPPYWQMRDYGVDGQLGLEPTPRAFVRSLVGVFREVRRVLKEDGTLWLNLGDTYISSSPYARTNVGTLARQRRSSQGVLRSRSLTGLKTKDLAGIPWRVALALQADGWFLRSDIIWHKSNALPESAKDRPTKAHEYLFLLTRSPKYYYDVDAIREPHKQSSFNRPQSPWAGQRFVPIPSKGAQNLKPNQMLHPLGKNRRSVWTIPVRSFRGQHFSTFPEKLVEPCIRAGSPPGGTVLDPFIGTGTTAEVALRLGRSAIGIELNPAYARMARERLEQLVHPRLN